MPKYRALVKKVTTEEYYVDGDADNESDFSGFVVEKRPVSPLLGILVIEGVISKKRTVEITICTTLETRRDEEDGS